MERDRQHDRVSKGEKTENGSLSQSTGLHKGEKGHNNARDNARPRETIQLQFDFATEPNRDVSINSDDKWLREGAKLHNERRDVYSKDSEQISRTSDTNSLFKQPSQNKTRADGILGDDGEHRNSILHRLQDSQSLYDGEPLLRTDGDELERTATSRSVQAELGKQHIKRTSPDDGVYRQDRKSDALHSQGADRRWGNKRERENDILPKTNQSEYAKSNDIRRFGREEEKETQSDGIFHTRRPRRDNNGGRDTQRATITSTYENKDFSFNGEVLVKGKKDRFYKNYEALKLTKELTKIRKYAIDNNRNFTITKEEQNIISQFTGWGGVSEAFDENNQAFKKENELLKNLLTNQEYKEAKDTVNTAYFTPQILVNTIHNALDRMGINEDENIKRVLEPSAGSGAFLKENPKFKYTTIEKNSLSSDMLTLLFPNQEHHDIGFEEDLTYKHNITKFDAIIGNPPFANIVIKDKNQELQKIFPTTSIHNFFATKSSYMLKDDGIMAFVMTTNFLDAKTDEIKKHIDKTTTFLGAVRLPEKTFDSTDTSTDIVFFKKGKDLNLNHNWLNTENFKDSSKVINSYFLENPQNVLGNLEIDIRGHGEQLVCVKNPEINLEEELNKFVQTLPKNIYKFHKNEAKINNEIYLDQVLNPSYYKELKEDNYLIFDDEIYIKTGNINNANGILVRKTDLKPAQQERVRNFIKLRDAHKELIELEKSDISDDDNNLVEARQKLNELLDIYHKKCGFLHNSSRKSGIKEDVDYAKIASLERNYQKPISVETALKNGIEPRKESCEKANILLRRVIRLKTEIKFDNEFDGLIASINLFGKPNIEYISQTLNKSSDEISNKLIEENKIFLDPIKLAQGQKEYILTAKYLSGDVRSKLRIAENLVEAFPELKKNVESLKEVIPVDLKPSEIDAPMGASWIPLKYYNDFFENEFGISREFWHLNRSDLSGEWHFEGRITAMTIYNKNRLSFERFSPYAICTHALQNTSVVIKKETDKVLLDVNGEPRFDKNGYPIMEKVVDIEKTQKINSIIEGVRQKFDNWLWKDYERRTELAKIYNNTFNCYAHKHYDGSDLKLDSLNSSINLRKHQKDAIFRAINEKNTLFDHEVGAGKTLTAICSVMKQKELGITNKALIAVPNHLVNQ